MKAMEFMLREAGSIPASDRQAMAFSKSGGRDKGTVRAMRLRIFAPMPRCLPKA
jgi:hypothetical protein